VQAAQQVEFTVAPAGDYPSQVPPGERMVSRLATINRDGGGGLLAAKGVTGVDPGGSADAELVAEAGGGVGPGRGGG
jgi:hypothetical protein